MSTLIEAAILTTETEPVLPMQLVGWGTLALSLLVTIAWVVSFYR
ncbi:hypothetical protein [Natrinema ejinorense]|nr:hypothetical protein [Natrinema ejinorense]